MRLTEANLGQLSDNANTRTGAAGFRWCVVGFCLLAVACSPPPDLSGPIERFVLVEDLVATAAASTSSTVLKSRAAPELRVTTAVPARASLNLDGRIQRREATSGSLVGPVDFAVEIGGHTIFERRLRSLHRNALFSLRVPLGRETEGEQEIVLRLANHDPQTTAAFWHRATLEELQPTPRQPAEAGANLLLIMVDTLRADHCSLYGYDRQTTPALDRFARRATVFDRAIAPSSWTLPSVASMLTGLEPPSHGSINGEALSHHLDMLPELALATGITTFAVSANPLVGPDHGFEQGFETFLHIPHERANTINQALADWLDHARGLRWFAYLHYMDPHDPYDAPGAAGSRWTDPSYDGPFARQESLDEVFLTVNFDRPPAHPISEADLDHLRATYDGEIRYFDDHFGRLIKGLETRDLLENTIVVVTADHGEEFADHELFKHGHQLFDETTRVPLVIFSPSVEGGRRRTATFACQRLFFIIARALQLPAAAGLGRRTDGAVFSHTTRPREPQAAFPRRALASIEERGFKLIHRFDDDSSLLYRIGDDPGERSDLAADHPRRLKRLRRMLRTWLKQANQARAARGTEPPELDQGTVDSLRALGYLD